MANAAKINKSEIVRKVLNDIGALSDTPPEGWRKTVEDRLAKKTGEDGKPLTMNSITIYQIRRKEMDKKAGTKSKGKGKIKAARKARKAKASSVTLEQLIEAKKFASEFGGLDRLESAVASLKLLG